MQYQNINIIVEYMGVRIQGVFVYTNNIEIIAMYCSQIFIFVA